MLRYLTPEWIDRLRELACADPALLEAARERSLILQQVVRATPRGEAAYYITLDEGVYVQAGRAAEPDVTFTQDWDTAVGVATGEINALDAFRDGRVELTGDPTALTDAQPVMRELDRVFAVVRSETSYS